MHLIRRRLRLAQDDGMTLVEVMVAMFIFALVSTGVVYTMLSVMSLGRDSRARQVATNLAAEAIDRAREEEDIFLLLDSTDEHELNGDTFHVQRTAAWVSDPDADLSCGGGGNALRYKRVNIEVSWENMRAGSAPVRTDTIIDPKSRVNDPTKGTLLVSVLNGEGTGTPGVTVRAQPINASGSPIGSALPAVTTDAQGCAYVLRVEPGNYRITIEKANHRDVENVASPTTTTGVERGSTASVAFSYDVMSRFRLTFAEGAEPTPAVAAAMPVTFSSTYGEVEMTGTGNPREFTLFPFASGYDALPGRYRAPAAELPTSGCLSPDPGAWSGMARGDRVAAAPGATVTAGVPMGVVSIDVGAVGGGQRQVRAVAVATPPAGTSDPGCQETYSFTFPANTLGSDGRATIALPYGTWELYRGGANPDTRITEAQMIPVTMGSVQGGPAATVTMDPRS